MSNRFEFMKNGLSKALMSDSLGQVTMAEGKPYQVIFDVPLPIGRRWGDLALKLLEVVTYFRQLVGDDDRVDSIEEALVKVWGKVRSNEEFWKVLLPASLGILGSDDEKDGLKYLETFPTNKELMDGFVEAAQLIVTYSFAGDDVQEAISKSKGGVDGEKEKAT